jgi:HSP20 family molecular chaperone IbpA
VPAASRSDLEGGKEVCAMTIVRWRPLQELDTMEWMRRMFDDLSLAPPFALPATDVYETEGEYVYEFEVPGFEEKELTVELTDHTLTIKGERLEEKEKKEKTFRLHERLSRSFERSFELPLGADTTKLDAGFAKGVLTVHAPKAKAEKPRKVKIAT